MVGYYLPNGRLSRKNDLFRNSRYIAECKKGGRIQAGLALRHEDVSPCPDSNPGATLLERKRREKAAFRPGCPLLAPYAPLIHIPGRLAALRHMEVSVYDRALIWAAVTSRPATRSVRLHCHSRRYRPGAPFIRPR